MTGTNTTDHLIQQHILEHQSRLKHVDELLERAQKKIAQAGSSDVVAQVEDMKRERDTLSSRVEEFKLKPPGQWSKEEFETKGPMMIWDALAQKLEKLVERIED